MLYAKLLGVLPVICERVELGGRQGALKCTFYNRTIDYDCVHLQSSKYTLKIKTPGWKKRNRSDFHDNSSWVEHWELGLINYTKKLAHSIDVNIDVLMSYIQYRKDQWTHITVNTTSLITVFNFVIVTFW